MNFLSLHGGALFACVAIIAAASYWLGFQHGAASQRTDSSAEPAPPVLAPAPDSSDAPTPSPAPHIPAYRVLELTVLMELGVLTPEEFEFEKGKLLARG